MSDERIFRSDSGQEFVARELLSVMGKEGCNDVRCTRRNGKCVDYHCPHCGESCSMLGHKNCQRAARQ